MNSFTMKNFAVGKAMLLALLAHKKKKDPERGITNTYGSFSRSDVMEVKMMMHPNDADLSVGDNCNNTNLCIARWVKLI